ncbi:MAG: SurA N-terminal domain-containing protein [Myxococcota bacterium]|nr:SurA N-terminal domain-containing protein [Myxococcota bacterium]
MGPSRVQEQARSQVRGALVALLCSGLAAPAAGARELIDAVAAQVGGGVVLLSEVYELTEPIERRMRQGGARESEILIMRSDVLERLIEQKLVAEVVRRMELSASNEEVDQAIRSIAQDTGITTQQLIRSVTSHGLTLSEYRDKIRSEIERSKVVNGMVRSKVQVSDEEIRTAYDERFSNQPSGGEEVHLRHIVVAYGEDLLRDGDAACQLTREGRLRIERGEISFPALAREIASANAARGGDLGWIHLNDVAAWMSDDVRELGGSGISAVIAMPFGCNLLQVVERRDYQPITFEQAAGPLEQAIAERKTEQEFVKWIDRVREQSYIERKGVFAEASRLTRGINGSATPQ